MAFDIHRFLARFKPRPVKSIPDLYSAQKLNWDFSLAHEAILSYLRSGEQEIDSEAFTLLLPRNWSLRSGNTVRNALNELWKAGVVKIRVKGKYPRERQLYSIEPHYRAHVEKHLGTK